jgi:3-oxoacyl-[acyl-carrier-protein] synthase-3
MAIFADITGWGKCHPPAVLSNDDLATVIETSDKWISSRSGIRERRVSHVPNSELARVAVLRALACAGVEPEEVDLLIMATTTGDNIIPATGSYVQRDAGLVNAAVFDLNAGCSGFVYSLQAATAMVQAGLYRKAVIVGSERITWLFNFSNRDTAVLFGDGAGAVVLEPSDEECGLIASHLGCEGEALSALEVPNTGTSGNRFVENYTVYDIRFDGREIFRRAVKGMAREVRHVLGELGWGNDDIELLVPHQANRRIIESLAQHLGMPMEKVVLNIDKYGNTSAASIPVALIEALEEGRIQPGDRILLAAFGAGLTRAAGMLRWGRRITPLGTSDAELPPCDQTALELLDEAIRNTQ